MAEKITEVMSPNPVVLQADDTVTRAAQLMRDRNIGNVLVLDGDTICGILTDADIVRRSVAEGRSPDSMLIRDICSCELTTLASTDTVDDAIRIMRERVIRRIPIVEDSRPVGIVSLGDLAIDRDPNSVLGVISAAPPNI